MTRETRKTVNTIVRYVVLIVVGFIMIYPLIWMVGATFKTNNEIFSGIGFIPKNPTLDGYKNALKSYGGDIDIFKAMINTYSVSYTHLRHGTAQMERPSMPEKKN